MESVLILSRSNNKKLVISRQRGKRNVQIVIFCLKNVGVDGEEYEKNVTFVGKCVSIFLLHALGNLKITGLLTFKG